MFSSVSYSFSNVEVTKYGTDELNSLFFFPPAGREARRLGAVEQGDDGAAEDGRIAESAEHATSLDVLAGVDSGLEPPLARRGRTPEAHPGKCPSNL